MDVGPSLVRGNKTNLGASAWCHDTSASFDVTNLKCHCAQVMNGADLTWQVSIGEIHTSFVWPTCLRPSCPLLPFIDLPSSIITIEWRVERTIKWKKRKSCLFFVWFVQKLDWLYLPFPILNLPNPLTLQPPKKTLPPTATFRNTHRTSPCVRHPLQDLPQPLAADLCSCNPQQESPGTD